MRYHAPLDPDCPVVARFNESINNPEDYIAGAPYDDIIEGFESKHRGQCTQCKEFGCANIEAVE